MCPFKALMMVIQLHLVLLFGLVSSEAPRASRGGAGTACPFARVASRVSAFIPQPVWPAIMPKSRPAEVVGRRLARKMQSKHAPGRLLVPTTIPVQPASGSALQAASVAAPPEPKAATAAVAASAAAQGQAARKEKKKKVVGPMEVHVIGLSIHTATVDVREKLAIPEDRWNEASAALCESGVIAEASVLSTCNRFEIYFAAQDSYAAFHEATKFLERHSGLPQTVLRRNLFLLSGEDCIWHLLRVAGGLDSLVVGEGQILSQVKQCYTHGIEATGKGGKVVSRLLNSAVAAGKRVRSETGISRGAVSISSAAVEFSEVRTPKDLGREFEDCRIAIIGAGKMSRLLMIHMASQGIKGVTLMNRGRERAEALAAEFPDMDVDIKLMDELWDVLGTHDIAYTSTSASGCLVTKAEMGARGINNPLVLVDISVPRNVEPECSERDGTFAYNVDHLKEVVDRNTAMRRKQIIEAEDLLMEELEKFRSWQFSLGAIPAITRLQEKAEAMRLEEMKKVSKKLNGLSDKELETVERLTKGIVNKLLHGPMSHLRATENLEKNLAALKTLKAVFEL